VGSGLILLVIVAAWLAVLVPMALRSNDTSTSLSSVDRFSDAMRVLSRRDAAARARVSRAHRYGLGDDDDELPRALDADDDVDEDWGEWAEWDERPTLRERAGRLLAPVAARLRRRSRRRATPAVRRRRLLVTLIGLAVVTLVGGLVGPGQLLVVSAVLAGLVALFVVQLRRLQVRRLAATRRAAAAAACSEVPAPGPRPGSRSVRVSSASVPADVPAPAPAVEQPLFDQEALEEPGVATAALPAPVLDPLTDPAAVPVAEVADLPAAVGDEPTHTRRRPAAALGAPWSPVPLPPPTYVTAPTAPRRIVDVTRPGAWSQPPVDAEPAARDGRNSAAGERRRAVNDW
jgi:hypothetical protein